MSSIPRPPVFRIVLVQLGLVLCVGLLGLWHSQMAAQSAALGGLAAALPNAYFVFNAFRYQGARDADKLARAFFAGAAWKFMLTALAFVVIFKMGLATNYIALFAGFVTVQLGQMASGKIVNL